MAKLKLFCELPNCCREELSVEAYDMCGNLRYNGRLMPNRAKLIELPDCCIRLKVTNHSGLTPGSISEYFSLKADRSLGLIFGRRSIPVRKINFTLTDAHYPNITPLSGGLTVMSTSNYTLNFNNGSAVESNMPVGTYTYVSNTIPGYVGANMEPFTISSMQSSAVIKISGNGTLTVNVVDDTGSKIQAGAVQMYANDGITPLGQSVDIVDGSAVFMYVPHSSAGVNFIIRQISTDGDHTRNDNAFPVSMTQSSQSIQIVDERKTVQANFTIVDAHYPGIVTPMDGEVVVSG